MQNFLGAEIYIFYLWDRFWTVFFLSSLKFDKVQGKLIFEIKNYKTLAEGPGVAREKHLKNKIKKKILKKYFEIYIRLFCFII